MMRNNGEWGLEAKFIVGAILHAAALAGRSLTDVFNWSRSTQAANEVCTILEDEARREGGLRDEWHKAINLIRREDPKMQSNIWFGVRVSLSFLKEAKVRDKLSATPGDKDYFDAETFLKTSGTIYLIAEGKGDATSASTEGGIYSLFLDYVAEVAHKVALESKHLRLDPPVAFILDELANISPWPRVSAEVTRGSGEGIIVMLFFQSREQCVSAYGAEIERTLWTNAATVILPGAKSVQYMDEVCRLVKPIRKVRKNRKHKSDGGILTGWSTEISDDERPGLTVAELMQVPKHTIIMLDTGGNTPVYLDVPPYWERGHAECIKASQKWHQNNPGKALESAIVPGGWQK